MSSSHTSASSSESPTPRERYTSGILVDLAHGGVTRAVSRVSTSAGSWLESLLSSVESWTTSATALGPYVLEDHVYGEGGYGRVLRGRDTTTGEHVAIKELPAGSDRRHSATVKEVAILRRLSDGGKSHPHIVGFKGYFERAEKHYIVMEACTGGELFERVTGSEVLSEEEGRGLFLQLVAGLQHAHACGVAHRDLKLENVLVTSEGTLKIADFGLAHLHRSRAEGGFEPERLREFCGSKSYCPPEMLAAQPYDAFSADVWSLGVCLFALLSGFFPFEEASPRDWRFSRALRAQMDGHSVTATIFGFYARPCPFSAELGTLLDEMLCVDPATRASLTNVAAAAWLLPPDQRPAPPAAPPPAAPPAEQPTMAKRTLSQGAAVDVAALDVAHRSGGGDDAAPHAAPPLLARQRACSRVAERVAS
jgi:serine/threonine protein kinase